MGGGNSLAHCLRKVARKGGKGFYLGDGIAWVTVHEIGPAPGSKVRWLGVLFGVGDSLAHCLRRGFRKPGKAFGGTDSSAHSSQEERERTRF